MEEAVRQAQPPLADVAGGAAAAEPPACYLIIHNVSKKQNSASLCAPG